MLETWALTKRLSDVITRADRRMLRYLAEVSLADRIARQEVFRSCHLECISSALKFKRLCWFGHVSRREEDEPLGRIQMLDAPGRRPRGRPKQTWIDGIKKIMRDAGIDEESAASRDEWRAICKSLTSSWKGKEHSKSKSKVSIDGVGKILSLPNIFRYLLQNYRIYC